MSRMSEIHMEIEEMLVNCPAMSCAEIAEKLRIPVRWVVDVDQDLKQEYNDGYDEH